MQMVKIKTIFKRRPAALLSAAALGSVILLAGCSHSAGTASGPASAPGAPPAGAPPTAAGIQSDIDRVKSDPNLTPAQRQIMLNEGQHALAKTQAGK